MRTIWKFHLDISQCDHKNRLFVDMPKNAKVLSVGSQDNNPYLWAMAYRDSILERRSFYIAGTGHDLRENIEKEDFIGTIILHNGSLVWHIFEIDPRK